MWKRLNAPDITEKKKRDFEHTKAASKVNREIDIESTVENILTYIYG